MALKHRPSQWLNTRSGERGTYEQYLTPESMAGDERAQLIDAVETRVVQEHVGQLPAGAVVLDVPCGNGRMTQWLARRADLNWVAIDFNRTMLEAMHVRQLPALMPRRVQGDAFNLPLADGSVDLVINLRLLHHIDDDARRLRMLSEMARVSFHEQSRGLVITSFWTTHCWRHFRKAAFGRTVKLYPIAPTHFRGLCTQAGLEVERIIPVKRYIEKQCLAICRSL